MLSHHTKYDGCPGDRAHGFFFYRDTSPGVDTHRYMYWINRTQHQLVSLYSLLRVSTPIVIRHEAFYKCWYRKNYVLHKKVLCCI